MNINEDSCPGTQEGADKAVRHPLVFALAGVLFLECAAISATVLFLVVELIVATPDSFVSAVALAVIAALAALWVGVIGVQSLQGKAWIRGAAITVQALFIAVAIGSFQGFLPRPDIGWLLLLPAVAVLFLLFTTPVRDATMRRD